MNYPTFRGVLRAAICNRTQAQFAKEAGLSPEHISRMLNNGNICRPSRATLIKIATVAKNGITFRNLQEALNQDDPYYKPKTLTDIEREAKLQEAKNDFTPVFKERAANTLDILCKIVKNMQTPYLTSRTINREIEKIIKNAKDSEHYPTNCLPVSYDIQETLDYYGTNYDAKKLTYVELSMSDGIEEARSVLLTYHDTVHGLTIIAGVSLSINDIFETYGLPPKIAGDEDTDFNEGNNLERVLEKPYYLTIQNTDLFTEPVQAQNLLDAIFGTPTIYPVTVKGVGFYIDKLPDDFERFVRNHKDAILEDWESDPERYKLLKTNIQEILDSESNNKSQELADFFDNIDYACEVSIEKGWRAAISNVMRIETTFDFEYLSPKKDVYPDKSWLSDQHAILLRSDYAEAAGVRRQTLLNLFCKYGRQLGVKTFGDILYYTMESDMYKLRTYNIRYPEKTDEPKLPEPAEDTDWDDDAIEFINYDDNNPETYPTETGIYEVGLKDGRFMNMMCIAKPDRKPIFVKYHKGWNNLVTCYHQLPNMKMTTEHTTNESASK